MRSEFPVIDADEIQDIIDEYDDAELAIFKIKQLLEEYYALCHKLI